MKPTKPEQPRFPASHPKGGQWANKGMGTVLQAVGKIQPQPKSVSKQAKP